MQTTSRRRHFQYRTDATAPITTTANSSNSQVTQSIYSFPCLQLSYPLATLVIFSLASLIFSRLLLFKSQTIREQTQIYRVDDADIVDSIHLSDIAKLDLFTETSLGILASLTLKCGAHASLYIPSTAIHTQPANTTSPSLFRLTQLLHLDHSFLPSFHISLPVILDPSIADRHVARSLLRILGFRSRTKVPESAFVYAYLTVFPTAPMPRISIIDNSSPHTYDWHLDLPTTEECRNSINTDSRSTQDVCRNLTIIMLMTYLGGCSPIASSDMFQWQSRLLLGVHRDCFSNGVHSQLTRDILLEYLDAICQLPDHVVEAVTQVDEMGWGVGLRTKEILELVTNERKRVICQEQGITLM